MTYEGARRTRPDTRAALLNAGRLNFDGRLRFAAVEAAADLVCYDATDPAQVVERAAGCAILITKELPLRRDVITRLPASVRLICEAGTGFDNIDLGAATERGITVCNVPGYSTTSVAQLTMDFILALSTGLHRLIRGVEGGDLADSQGPLRSLHSDVQGKTLGVIGAGAIGERVIRLGRALDMSVRVHSRSRRAWTDAQIRQQSLADVFAESDFVSLHCPYSAGTRHTIRAETLGWMRRSAYLINTARGGLVNHDDLVDALNEGKLAGAALDVQDPEPLPPGHALWRMSNVILTPHIGWKAVESRVRLIEGVAGNIRAFLAGTAVNVVTG